MSANPDCLDDMGDSGDMDSVDLSLDLANLSIDVREVMSLVHDMSLPDNADEHMEKGKFLVEVSGP